MISFSRTGLPAGRQNRSQYSLESWTSLLDSVWVRGGSHGPGLASQSPGTGNASRPQQPGTSFAGWQETPASPAPLGLSHGISTQEMHSPQACPGRPSIPGPGGARQTHRRLAGRERSQALTWMTAIGLLLFHTPTPWRSCEGSSPPTHPGEGDRWAGSCYSDPPG